MRIADRYEIGAELHEGAMGILYRSRDLKTGAPVAIKTLTPRQMTSARNIQCLRTEYAMARGISHPNVVRFFDLVEENGKPYLIMELIEGIDLRERLASGSLPLPEGLEVAKGVAAALRALHEHVPEHPIVHCDVKPENVMLRAGGGPLTKDRVILVDFGTALVSTRREGAVQRAISKVAGLFQGAPVIGGSSLYMSPEQAMPQDIGIDPRADLYALGAVLFELLAGRPPFLNQADERDFTDRGRSVLSTPEALLKHHYSEELKRKHLTAAPPSPRKFNSDIPAILERIVMRCLEKRPEQRFASALELQSALTSLQFTKDGTLVATRRIQTEPETVRRPCLLKVVAGPLKGRAFPLEGGSVRAGRRVKGPNDILLPQDDKRASREHALFQRSGDRISVIDLDSTSGTLVNGTRVPKARLKDGDKVVLGRTVVKIVLK